MSRSPYYGKPTTLNEKNIRLYKTAFGLSVFTIFYNIVEGLISIILGFSDDSLTLFGFGADSFIEAISGLGIAHMVLRIRQKPDTDPDTFEKTALQITGFAFYILVIGLVITSFYNLWTGQKPSTTFWGVIISLISMAVMWALIYWKTKVGRALHSNAILADVACTRVCIYMSVILLLSSVIYELTHVAYIDSLGTLGLAWFSYREGKECFEKAGRT